MTPCLVDINVLVALLAGRHIHHKAARRWFSQCAEREIGICRYVQIGVIRLLCNPAVMQRDALNGFAAFRILHELLDMDERIEWLADHKDVDLHLPRCLTLPTPANKTVNDAYLAALAIASKRRLVTFDSGFKNYESLDLLLLS